MLHDPQTRAPYRHWGLFAPLTAFERLSGDLGAYMRMVQEGLLLCVLATLASIPSFILNFNGAGGPIGTYNRWMSIGVAAELSWGHVLSQAVVSCMCLYYIRRQRSYLIDTQMQKNKVARRFVDAARKQRKLRDRMRAVLKRGGRAGHHTERARAAHGNLQADVADKRRPPAHTPGARRERQAGEQDRRPPRRQRQPGAARGVCARGLRGGADGEPVGGASDGSVGGVGEWRARALPQRRVAAADGSARLAAVEVGRQHGRDG